MSNVGEASVKTLPGIGRSRAEAYARIGIETVSDLLYHFPRSYENRGDVKLLSECVSGDKSSVELTVATQPKKALIRRGMELLKFNAYDSSGVCEITFFNQNYLFDKFPLGATFRFYGAVECSGRRYKMSSPSYEPCIEGVMLAPLVPVYPLTEGISKNRISSDIRLAMSLLADSNPDFLPEDIRRRYGLCTLSYAIKNIHLPQDMKALSAARRRLVFDEFFIFAVGMRSKKEEHRLIGAPICDKNDITPITEQLPYELTDGQKKVICDIKRDMARPSPMNRIIVGDVGCGKTICAAAAMYIAVNSGCQAVLMAPTEILARQHFSEISSLFEKRGIKTELLVGSMTAAQKRDVHKRAANGDIDVLIGTHALISERVEFDNVGIVITDEQHRFGAGQRAALSKKGQTAHTLVMSATPIPRSLALILYGDLDISKIDEMPKGRQRVDTFAVDESYRERLDVFIEKQVRLGGQVYIVCPSVDEREETDDGEIALSDLGAEKEKMPPLKAAVKYAGELSERLPELNIAFLHGKMKGTRKDEIMKAFSLGEIDVLVSTTVIEVGVNVPRATLMIVENAERFGLSQLHQLRGRVGRGSMRSYCVLVSDSKGEKTRSRIETMRTEYDGYKIAEKDLLLRGPGDFMRSSCADAIRQSGGIRFKLADMSEDSEILNMAYSAAQELLSEDNDLSAYPEVKAAVGRAFSLDIYSSN